jgi:transposase
VLRHHFNWKRLPVPGALAYQPDGSQAALMFQIKEGSHNTESLISFLHDLHEHFAGAHVTLIWDGLPSHRSTVMKDWITTKSSWLTVERLPGYAHDLNPIEMVWATSRPSTWPACARTSSTRPGPQPSLARTAPAAAHSCASPSWPTPAFLYAASHSITERSLSTSELPGRPTWIPGRVLRLRCTKALRSG